MKQLRDCPLLFQPDIQLPHQIAVFLRCPPDDDDDDDGDEDDDVDADDHDGDGEGFDVASFCQGRYTCLAQAEHGNALALLNMMHVFCIWTSGPYSGHVWPLWYLDAGTVH